MIPLPDFLFWLAVAALFAYQFGWHRGYDLGVTDGQKIPWLSDTKEEG